MYSNHIDTGNAGKHFRSHLLPVPVLRIRDVLSRIPDPDPDPTIAPSRIRIPDPGGKKAPDPGSRIPDPQHWPVPVF
jgi:hypothetical protein